MKTSFALVAVGAALLATGNAFAQGSMVIIKQRAKELRDQNNVRQGVPSPAPPAASAAPAATPTAAAPARPLTAQEQILARLRADLTAIKPEAPATLALKLQLAKDLVAAAQGPKKPSQLGANRLAEDLSSALSEKLLSAATRQRLLQDLNAVLNPQKIGPSQMSDIVGDIQAIFQANYLDRKQAVAIANDAKAIALEIQKPAVK